MYPYVIEIHVSTAMAALHVVKSSGAGVGRAGELVWDNNKSKCNGMSISPMSVEFENLQVAWDNPPIQWGDILVIGHKGKPVAEVMWTPSPPSYCKYVTDPSGVDYCTFTVEHTQLLPFSGSHCGMLGITSVSSKRFGNTGVVGVAAVPTPPINVSSCKQCDCGSDSTYGPSNSVHAFWCQKKTP